MENGNKKTRHPIWGLILKNIRKLKGLSVRQLAESLDYKMDESEIRRHEKGESLGPKKIAIYLEHYKLEEFLGEILGYEEEKLETEIHTPTSLEKIRKIANERKDIKEAFNSFIGRLIRSRRWQKGITLKSLVEELGAYSTSSLSRLENGALDFEKDQEKIKNVSEALGLSLEEIISRASPLFDIDSKNLEIYQDLNPTYFAQYYRLQCEAEQNSSHIWICTPTLATPLTVNLENHDGFWNKEGVSNAYDASTLELDFQNRVKTLRKTIQSSPVTIHAIFDIDSTIKRIKENRNMHDLNVLKKLLDEDQNEGKVKLYSMKNFKEEHRSVFSFALCLGKNDSNRIVTTLCQAPQAQTSTSTKNRLRSYTIVEGNHIAVQDSIEMMEHYQRESDEISLNDIIPLINK